MSASIHWRKIKNSPDPRLGVSAPSSFIEAMERAFGGRAWELDAKAVPVLRGMAAVSNDEAFEQMIELIEKFGEIEVYYQY